MKTDQSDNINASNKNEPEIVFSDPKFRLLFDNISDAILVANNEGQYIEANAKACSLLGYTREELMTKSIAEIVCYEPFSPGQPDNYPSYNSPNISELKTIWKDFIAEGVQKGSIKCRHKNEQIIELEYSALANFQPGLHVSVLKETNVAEKVLANIKRRDINQKLFQEIRSESIHARFQAIIKAMPDMIFILSDAGVIKDYFVPDNLDLITEKADITGSKMEDILPDVAEKTSHKDFLDKSLKSKGLVVYEFLAIVNGYLRKFEMRLSPINENELLCIVRDITIKHLQESQLRETRKRLEMILNYSTHSMLILESDYTIKAFNKYCAESVREILNKEIREGESMLDYMLDRDIEDFKKNFHAALKGKSIYVEKPFYNPAIGKTMWFSFTYHHVPGDTTGKDYVLMNTSDITTRKEAESMASKEGEMQSTQD